MTLMVGIDQIRTEAEQSAAVLNALLANRYIGKLRLKVAKQLELLVRLGDILEMWGECQKRWVYLSNIFTSDLKKQFSK